MNPNPNSCKSKRCYYRQGISCLYKSGGVCRQVSGFHRHGVSDIPCLVYDRQRNGPIVDVPVNYNPAISKTKFHLGRDGYDQ